MIISLQTIGWGNKCLSTTFRGFRIQSAMVWRWLTAIDIFESLCPQEIVTSENEQILSKQETLQQRKDEECSRLELRCCCCSDDKTRHHWRAFRGIGQQSEYFGTGYVFYRSNVFWMKPHYEKSNRRYWNLFVRMCIQMNESKRTRITRASLLSPEFHRKQYVM